MKKIFIVSLFLLVAGITNAQSSFQKKYWGIERSSDILQTSDGGFVLTGFRDPNLPVKAIWLLKTNSYGDTLWTKTYGSTETLLSRKVIQTLDGGFLIGGSEDSISGNGNVLLIKTDSIGNVQWSKIYADALQEFFGDVVQAADSSYMLVMSSNSFGTLDNDIYLLKLDPSGNCILKKEYGTSSGDHSPLIIPTTDGNFMLFFNSGTGSGMVKIDPQGDTLWTKPMANSDRVIGLSDGSFVCLTAVFQSNDWVSFLIKVDAGGNHIWTKSYHFDPILFLDFCMMPDGGFLLTGTHDFYDGIIVKTNSLGDIEWVKNNGDIYPTAVTGTSDGGAAILGFTFTGSTWFVKLDETGTTGCNQTTGNCLAVNVTNAFSGFSVALNTPPIAVIPFIPINGSGLDSVTIDCFFDEVNEIDLYSLMTISPNPAHAEILVEFLFEKGTIEVLNVMGKKMLEPFSFSGSRQRIDVSILPAGIYFLQLQSAKGISVLKFIKD